MNTQQIKELERSIELPDEYPDWTPEGEEFTERLDENPLILDSIQQINELGTTVDRSKLEYRAIAEMVEEGFAIWTICRVMSNLNADSKWYSYPGNVQEYRIRMIQAVVNDARRDSNVWWTESHCSICDKTKSTVSKHSLDGDTTNHCEECFEAIQAIAMSINDSGQEHTIDGEPFRCVESDFDVISAIFFGAGAAYRAIERYKQNLPIARKAIESFQNRMVEIVEDVKTA